MKISDSKYSRLIDRRPSWNILTDCWVTASHVTRSKTRLWCAYLAKASGYLVVCTVAYADVYILAVLVSRYNRGHYTHNEIIVVHGFIAAGRHERYL